MLLRKRPRGPIKRTTSMTGINVDLSDMEGVEAPPAIDNLGEVVAGHGGFDHRLMSTVSPRYHKKSSGGGSDHAIVETPHFLRTCGLCKRRLAPSRDIYMYRGDTAFCSQECREQQMKHDERKENCSMAASKKDENHHHHHHHQSTPATNTASSEA